jgi:hypothetical protein
MLNVLKFLVMAIAALAEQAFLPDQSCVRGASDAAKAARRREKNQTLASCAGAESPGALAGAKS